MDLSTEAVERVATKLEAGAAMLRSLRPTAAPGRASDYEEAANMRRALAGEREAKWRCDWPGCTNTERHGHAGMPP